MARAGAVRPAGEQLHQDHRQAAGQAAAPGLPGPDALDHPAAVPASAAAPTAPAQLDRDHQAGQSPVPGLAATWVGGSDCCLAPRSSPEARQNPVAQGKAIA